ncbi:homocysteine S-methyltransferase family protein [candidate division KSB1 bacterium]
MRTVLMPVMLLTSLRSLLGLRKMPKNLLQRINNGNILFSDGAFGTLLFDKGLEPGACPDELNLSNPGILQEIARAYIDAGSDIIHTGTFGSSPMKLAEYGLEDKTAEINRTAVAIFKEIAGDTTLISASVGPSGKILKPYGDADPELLYEGYLRQMEALISAGVDCITIETMTDLSEAVLPIKAAKTISKDIPVIATMTFDKIPRGFFTVMGVDIKAAAEGLKDAGADVIGSNCGNGIDIMVEIARVFKNAADIPVMIQSNAGIPQLQDGKVFYPESAEYFAEKTSELIEAGVAIIGGCCGSTPEHIKAMKEMFSNR